jgi:hypothetical protein
MKMELFLNHINQEMIDANSGEKVIRDLKAEIPAGKGGTLPESSWWISWTVSCCIADFSLSIDEEELINPAEFTVMRRERDGGLIWNKRNQKVFKVDEEAYHAIIEMDAGVCIRKIAAKHRISKKEVVKLAKQLKQEFGQ